MTFLYSLYVTKSITVHVQYIGQLKQKLAICGLGFEPFTSFFYLGKYYRI